MDSLPPIPIPAARRWREFRVQILPTLVFIAILSMIVMMWRNFVQPPGVVGKIEAVKANTTSSHDVVVAELHVDLLHHVTNSQAIGTIIATDPDILEASVAAAEADLPPTRP